jgi:hypothetical protein
LFFWLLLLPHTSCPKDSLPFLIQDAACVLSAVSGHWPLLGFHVLIHGQSVPSLPRHTLGAGRYLIPVGLAHPHTLLTLKPHIPLHAPGPHHMPSRLIEMAGWLLYANLPIKMSWVLSRHSQTSACPSY